MAAPIQKKLFEHVDKHADVYVEEWKQLYTQLNHDDDNSQKILETVLLQMQGMRTQVLSKQIPLVYGELSVGAASTLLFYHGYDIHTPNLMTSAALLSALEVCKEVSGRIPVNIKWLLDGSRKDDLELDRCLAEHNDLLQADACLWYYTGEAGAGDDDRPILTLGTKGRLCIELKIQTANTALDAMHGAIVPNALWRLLWALTSLKDAWEDVKIEGFYETLTPAQDNASAALYSLPEKALARNLGVQQFLMDLHGFQLHYTHRLTPTCTVTAITSNTAGDALATTIPTQAKAQVDFHLVPDQDPQDIFAKIQQYLQLQGFQDVQLRMLYANRPTTTSVNHPFVRMVTQATEKAYERAPYLLPMTAASYALSSLQKKSSMPIILMARNEQEVAEASNTFIATIKQIALIIEELAYATDTTQ